MLIIFNIAELSGPFFYGFVVLLPSSLQSALGASRDGETGRLSWQVIDWGESGASVRSNGRYQARASENATEQQCNFHRGGDSLFRERCCIVQKAPDGGSGRKG